MYIPSTNSFAGSRTNFHSLVNLRCRAKTKRFQVPLHAETDALGFAARLAQLNKDV